MKISELKNAPQWLLDARTDDADVEWASYGSVVWRGGVWHGGDWHGGVWLGGDWHGGDWLGGVWRGGVWHGGVWLGGVWRGGVWLGGDWLGGDWHGGDWLGGVWRGGVWHGGVWLGGVWLGGDWRGEKITENLWTVYGLRWPITISQTRMQIGCELRPFSDWASLADEHINKMDRGALKFWRANKAALLALCDSRKPEEPKA